MKTHHIFILGLFLSVLVTGCGDDDNGGGGGGGAGAGSSAQQVALGDAGSFTILSKTGITNSPTSAITGDIGVSPASGASIGVTCAEVSGAVFAVDAAGPAPCSQNAPG